MRNFEAKKDGDVWDIKLQMSFAKLSSKLEKRASFNLKY